MTKKERKLKLTPKEVKRHNGMIPDREEPATRKHGIRESLSGTISEAKSAFRKR